LKALIRDIRNLLFRPRDFFANQEATGELGRALAAGLICHWIGAAIRYGFSMAVYQSMIEELIQRASFVLQPSQLAFLKNSWIFGAGAILLDPFITLAGWVVLAFLTFLGAKVFVRHPVQFETILKIMGWAGCASIAKAVPVVGDLFFWVYEYVLLVIGLTTLVKIESNRAILVALFPAFVFLGLFLAAIVLVFAGFSILGSMH
jgi:hypothetical protein